MKSKLIYLIPIVFAAIIAANVELNIIDLKPMKDINLSTLFMSFPIILALIERFNELFIVNKIDGSREKNVKNTSLSSFCVGIILAIAGFRILENFLVIPDNEVHIFQLNVFKFTDIILTAGVLAGGTDGWHQIIALLQDLTKSKREEVAPTN